MTGHSGEQVPLISVVMPVFNGAATLDRAVGSVIGQEFAGWELLAVDDGSTDGSYKRLLESAERDGRVRVKRMPENRGVGATRNVGLRLARGEFVAWLDHDDEYYPHYLAKVARRVGGPADVLVCGYDVVTEGAPSDEAYHWNPARHRRELFACNIVTPLGVALRRELALKLGGFNELLWREEDSDLWKRLARAGARFSFLPIKSGRYHVRSNSQARMPHVSRWQRERIAANLEAQRPPYADDGYAPSARRGSPDPAGTADRRSPERADKTAQDRTDPAIRHTSAERTDSAIRPTGAARRVERIAFASPHCLVDFTSGAAVATARGLKLLQQCGFDCQAFCASQLDAPEEVLFQELLAEQREPYETRNARIGRDTARMVFTFQGRVPVTVVETASSRRRWLESEAEAFLQGYDRFLDKYRPDVVLTYGGDPIAQALTKLTKRRDIPVVFWLHNFAYNDADVFRPVDAVIVPSRFSAEYYLRRLGLVCTPLPSPIDWSRVLCRKRVESPESRVQSQKLAASRRVGLALDSGLSILGSYVTFVNPVPAKGLYVFARIAGELARRRPDIPLLVVESRGQSGALWETGVDLRAVANLRLMPNTADPREFFRLSRILLVPSLGRESFGLVPAEALINGIPVLASNRGALPETLGEAGFLFDVPERYTPETRDVPSAEEVRPWVERIIRLWDDVELYRQASERAAEHARRWHPERLGPLYREFFANVTPQPFPPLLPATDQWAS